MIATERAPPGARNQRNAGTDMATTVEQTSDPMRAVTPDEGRAIFDHQARRLLGISGEDFLRRWDAGEYREIADTPGNLHLMYLALLAPFAQQDR